MTRDELGDCYVPLPLRWRHVQPGDVIVGAGDKTWAVERVAPRGAAMHVTIRCGSSSWSGPVEADEAAQVLVPVPMAEAMRLTRDELGATLITRRVVTETEGAAA